MFNYIFTVLCTIIVAVIVVGYYLTPVAEAPLEGKIVMAIILSIGIGLVALAEWIGRDKDK